MSEPLDSWTCLSLAADCQLPAPIPTAPAEYNILTDPHAASILLNAEVPVIMAVRPLKFFEMLARLC